MYIFYLFIYSLIFKIHVIEKCCCRFDNRYCVEIPSITSNIITKMKMLTDLSPFQQGLCDFIICQSKSISNCAYQILMSKVDHGSLCFTFFSGFLLRWKYMNIIMQIILFSQIVKQCHPATSHHLKLARVPRVHMQFQKRPIHTLWKLTRNSEEAGFANSNFF